VDVSGLMLNQSLRAGDLPIDKSKLKLITDGNSVLAHVVTLRVEEEKPAEAAAVVAEAPAEPEVIKKGKKEEEGEEGAEPAEKQEKKK
jgi:large subunit ribosomal protein L25